MKDIMKKKPFRCGHDGDIYVTPQGKIQCRICRRAAKARSIARNPSSRKETRRVTSQRWAANNPEVKAERRRQWRTNNPLANRAQYKRYAMSHPEKMREKCSLRASRFRKAGLFLEPVDREAVFKRDAGVCGICTLPVDPTSWHLDHIIPLARGGAHSYANTQVTHPACNWRKGTT